MDEGSRKQIEEIKRLLAICGQLPMIDEVQSHWLKVSALLTEYIELQMPVIEARENLNKKWLIAGVALQSFLTELIAVKETQEKTLKGEK